MMHTHPTNLAKGGGKGEHHEKKDEGRKKGMLKREGKNIPTLFLLFCPGLMFGEDDPSGFAKILNSDYLFAIPHAGRFELQMCVEIPPKPDEYQR